MVLNLGFDPVSEFGLGVGLSISVNLDTFAPLQWKKRIVKKYRPFAFIGIHLPKA